MPGHSGGGHSGGGGHMGGGHSSFGGGSHSSHSSFSGGSHMGGSRSSFGGGSRGGMGGGPRPGGPMGGGPRPGPRPFFGGPRYYGGYYGPGYYGRRRGNFASGLVILILLFICVPIIFISAIFHNITDNDYDYDYSYDYSYGEYTKLTPDEPYDTNNVIDNTGVVVNETVLSEDLQEVYDKTGIQPYILVVDNQNNTYGDEEEMETYSNTYYDNNIEVENGLLLTYFYSGDDIDSRNVVYTLGYDTEDFVDYDFAYTMYENLDDDWNQNGSDQTKTFYTALVDTVDSLDIVDPNETSSDESIDVTPAVVEHESFFQRYKKSFIALGAALAALLIVLGVNKRRKIKENATNNMEDMNQYYEDNTDNNDTYSSTK